MKEIGATRMFVVDRKRRLALTCVLTCCFLPCLANETIERIKTGVVAVGTFKRIRTPPFRFLGTGFAVDDGTAIATNAHILKQVLGDGPEPEVLAVLLPSADANAVRILEASRFAIDEEHDLALLRLTSGRLPALPLRESDSVHDGDEFLFTGFPIGAVLGPFAATHRAMVSAVTPIAIPSATADSLDPRVVRRLQRGTYPIYQLDGTAYPGNSGSPLYDSRTGEVVGVINMVFVKGLKENALAQPSGISYAIPVRHLRELVAKSR